MKTSFTVRSVALTSVVAALTSSFSLAGHAAQSEAPQAIVNYADLAVTTSQGAATLYRRISAAAQAVCRPLDGDRNLARQALFDDCVRKAVAEAVTKVGQPALTAVYRVKNPQLSTIRVASR